MSWNPLDSPVDYVVVAGKRSPGIAAIEGAVLTQRYDERKSYGTTGSTLVWKGRALAPFKIKLRLITTAHWEAWNDWKGFVLSPPNSRTPRALDVEHPFLATLGITSMVVTDVKQPEQTADGEWTVEISCKEYRAPVRAIARPSGSASSTETPDPVEQEIARLTAQYQGFASQ